MKVEEWDNQVVVINGMPVRVERANLIQRSGEPMKMHFVVKVSDYTRIVESHPDGLDQANDWVRARPRSGDDTVRYAIVHGLPRWQVVP